MATVKSIHLLPPPPPPQLGISPPQKTIFKPRTTSIGNKALRGLSDIVICDIKSGHYLVLKKSCLTYNLDSMIVFVQVRRVYFVTISVRYTHDVIYMV